MNGKAMYEFKYERYDSYLNDHVPEKFFVEFDDVKKFIPLYNEVYHKHFDVFDFINEYDNFFADEWDYFHDWAVEKGYSYKQIFYPENKLEELK